jgi:hypothetical protein
MEEVYEFILDKCINHNNNNKFNHYYDIDDFLADIINNNHELFDPIFNNNTEVKEEDNVIWYLDRIKMKVIYGTYGEFAYSQTLQRLYKHFGFSK